MWLSLTVLWLLLLVCSFIRLFVRPFQNSLCVPCESDAQRKYEKIFGLTCLAGGVCHRVLLLVIFTISMLFLFVVVVVVVVIDGDVMMRLCISCCGWFQTKMGSRKFKNYIDILWVSKCLYVNQRERVSLNANSKLECECDITLNWECEWEWDWECVQYTYSMLNVCSACSLNLQTHTHWLNTPYTRNVWWESTKRKQ